MNESLITLEREVSFSPKEVETIRAAIMPSGSTETDLQLFLAQCRRTGLDPISRQIYCFKQKEKLVIGSTIDGFRIVAERSGKYTGQKTYWCGEDGEWKDIWLSDKPPVAAKVEVYRSDFTQPLTAVAKYESYKQTYFDQYKKQQVTSPQWVKQPDNMTAIAAERLALRKAFPNDLSGIYAKEEIDAFSDEKVVVHTNPKEMKMENIGAKPIKSMDVDATIIPSEMISTKDTNTIERSSIENEETPDIKDILVPFIDFETGEMLPQEENKPLTPSEVSAFLKEYSDKGLAKSFILRTLTSTCGITMNEINTKFTPQLQAKLVAELVKHVPEKEIA